MGDRGMSHGWSACACDLLACMHASVVVLLCFGCPVTQEIKQNAMPHFFLSALPPSLPLQAPEPDVEGVVVHATPSGEPTQGVVCHGKGSFLRTLREMGEPPTAVEPSGDESEGSGGEEGETPSEAQAATVA